MSYRLNKDSGIIHDANKPHVKAIRKGTFIDFKTVQEARAHAYDAGKRPQACKLCNFPQALRDEINR